MNRGEKTMREKQRKKPRKRKNPKTMERTHKTNETH
jgi:hypothetical protein